jgi:hypothetical protein
LTILDAEALIRPDVEVLCDMPGVYTLIRTPFFDEWAYELTLYVEHAEIDDIADLLSVGARITGIQKATIRLKTETHKAVLINYIHKA